ncbi:MAG: hypothetical protein HFJ26_03940 [Clostridia bacterium]|nr:hypothetical protein [Clostridia bacterium]
MKTVTSKIKLNAPKIKQLDRAAITSLEKTVSALHTEVVNAQVMPFKSGNMQNDNTYEDYSNSKQGKVSLNTSTPYARRMYFHPEYNFSKEENPNARGNWYEPWTTGKEKDFCKKAFSQFYKKEAGL